MSRNNGFSWPLFYSFSHDIGQAAGHTLWPLQPNYPCFQENSWRSMMTNPELVSSRRLTKPFAFWSSLRKPMGHSRHQIKSFAYARPMHSKTSKPPALLVHKTLNRNPLNAIVITNIRNFGGVFLKRFFCHHTGISHLGRGDNKGVGNRRSVEPLFLIDELLKMTHREYLGRGSRCPRFLAFTLR